MVIRLISDNYSTGKAANELNIKYIKDDIENIDKIEIDFVICFHLAAQSRVQP